MDRETEMPPLPEGMPCPGCGYDVGGLRSGVCPECGRAVSRWDVATFEQATEATARLRRVQRQTVRVGLFVAGVLGVAVGAAVGDVLASVLVGAGAAGLTAGVIGIGWLVGRGVGRAERLVVEAAFVNSARWLLLPWAAVAPLGVLLLAAGALVWATGVGGPVVLVLGILMILLWIALTLLITPAVGIGAMGEPEADTPRPAAWAWVLAIVLLWGPSAVLGGVSLAAVVMGSAAQSERSWSVLPELPNQK